MCTDDDHIPTDGYCESKVISIRAIACTQFSHKYSPGSEDLYGAR